MAQTNTVKELENAGFFDKSASGNDRSRASAAPNRTVTSSTTTAPPDTQHVGLGVQTRLLFEREIKKLLRDKFAFVIRVTSNTAFGLLFGFIFMSVGRSDYVEYPEVMASFGAQSNLLISTMFGVAQGR